MLISATASNPEASLTATPLIPTPLVSTPQAITIPCGEYGLIGTVYRGAQQDATNEPRQGLIIISAPPQYRAGPHRQFVRLARRGAADGITTFLVDLPGVGDSESGLGDAYQGIEAIVDFVRQRYPEIEHLGLYGLCDGANLAIEYAAMDERVSFLVLSNPWLEGGKVQAKVKLRRYYLARLFSAQLWKSLFAGEVRVYQSLAGLFSTLWALVSRENGAALGPTQPILLAHLLLSFQGSILMFLSGNDATGRHAEELLSTHTKWKRLGERASTRVIVLENADHTLTNPLDENTFVANTLSFITGSVIPPGAPSDPESNTQTNTKF